MIRHKAQASKDLAKVEKIKAKAKSKKVGTNKFSEKDLIKDILREGKTIGASEKVVEKYAPKVAEKVRKWVEKRAEVTKDDVNRMVAKEIEKYNRDLAFIYKNRGKII
ncbi:hypothetical protein IK112_00765 [Candidatus Saccharibacteria bacterium]|nr:hypothetical protein [Candidatus Saccharibacteria bacterium]